jgi:acetyl esterase/lipase
MSWQASFVSGALRLLRVKQSGSSPDKAQRAIDRSRAKGIPHPPPSKACHGLEVGVDSDRGYPVYEVRPQSGEVSRRVVYLHGGSYTFQIAGIQWRFVLELARSVPAHLTVPIYPLAPEAKAATTVPAMTDLLEQIIDEAGAEQVTLIGDSAGGGMALAVAQQLRKRGKQPARIILLSPWLDVSMSDPRLAEVEPRDPMLSLAGLAYCGKCYAGDLDPKDPMASPLYGDLSGLAPIDLFIGTHDVLWVDAIRLAERAAAVAADVRMHEAPNMLHVYPMITFAPEGKAARREVITLIQS